MRFFNRMLKLLWVVVATLGATQLLAQELVKTKARRASDFVNYIGVNTHFGYYVRPMVSMRRF